MNRLTITGFYFRPYRGYRKIPKISPGAYIFKGPFGGAYIRRGLSTEPEICVSKSIDHDHEATTTLKTVGLMIKTTAKHVQNAF